MKKKYVKEFISLADLAVFRLTSETFRTKISFEKCFIVKTERIKAAQKVHMKKVHNKSK